MADTKKEHYVPQCYLKNFVNENDELLFLTNYHHRFAIRKLQI